MKNCLLTVEQMTKADNSAIAGGIPADQLMEAAGRAVFTEITKRWQPRPVLVLCGPGKNGGDGFVIARLLKDAGWPVRVACVDKGGNDVLPLAPDLLKEGDLIVDALFGAGLTRPLEGSVKATIQAINKGQLDCVAVDLPSGVNGDNGAILGAAPNCVLSVTFFRRKPGHLLLPGRELMGHVVVADIGIPESVLEVINPQTFVNGPELWQAQYPWPVSTDNKFSRGHAVIVGGGEMTGAARLAATAARRIGAGLATIVAPGSSIDAYAVGDPGNIVLRADHKAAFQELLEDERKNAILVGPGCGINDRTRDLALAALGSGRPTVLDADAISVFADDPAKLFAAISKSGPVILTPHEGEFNRIFNGKEDKVKQTLEASSGSGATVLLKGADTVIATVDGRVCINEGAPPTLATAGSGDVLAGFVVGLLAQGMQAFDAASAACWLHGQAAASFGPALIAEDLAECLSGVLRDLQIAGNN